MLPFIGGAQKAVLMQALQQTTNNPRPLARGRAGARSQALAEPEPELVTSEPQQPAKRARVTDSAADSLPTSPRTSEWSCCPFCIVSVCVSQCQCSRTVKPPCIFLCERRFKGQWRVWWMLHFLPPNKEQATFAMKTQEIINDLHQLWILHFKTSPRKSLWPKVLQLFPTGQEKAKFVWGRHWAGWARDR